MVEVDCDNCGETTDKRLAKIERNDHVFCSRECYHDFGRPDMEGENNPSNPAKEMVTISCEMCDDEFEVHPYRADSARFCSRDCKDENLAGQTGKGTPAWVGAKVTGECKYCGEEFKAYSYYSRDFCSKQCFREWSQDGFAGEGNPVWRGGYDGYYGSNWDQQREKALERDEYTCQECGKHADEMDQSPHIHHKKRLGWFKEEYDAPEWYEKANVVDNLETLCAACHMAKEWKEGGAQLGGR